ncbi:MAG TPA: hypothetical protein VFF15_00270 [Flavobacteriaceae bacterium]|nr:hypothetical protein [Flavobacteriaceae bacterium]
MNNLKWHNILSSAALLLALCLLFPSVVKFAHIFEHHRHEVCLGEHTEHLHKVDKECEFYKFKLNAPFSIPENTFTLAAEEHPKKDFLLYYTSSYSLTPLYFSLRGPPANV